MEKIELKKSLQEIRNSIDLAKKVWIHRQVTNCYAYALGIDYGSIDPKDPIKDDSWKIALLLPGKDASSRFNNFHFIRQREDGLWYHKKGYGGEITKFDDYDFLIKNPEEALFKHLKYDSCFQLRLK